MTRAEKKINELSQRLPVHPVVPVLTTPSFFSERLANELCDILEALLLAGKVLVAVVDMLVRSNPISHQSSNLQRSESKYSPRLGGKLSTQK